MHAEGTQRSGIVEAKRRSDEELFDTRAVVLSAAAGDQRAWSHLVDRYDGAIVATARGLGLGVADVADVSQTTWLRLVEHIDSLRQPERVRAWLVTTARHEALRLLRQRKRETTSDDLTEVAMEPPEQGMDGALIAAEQRKAVGIAMQALTPRRQRLVHLLMADMSSSYAEVAAELGMPVGSLGPTRARCLARLGQQEALQNLLAS